MDENARCRNPTTPISPYGRWIRTRLMDLNMTQRELAREVGVREQHLSSIIHGTWDGGKYRPLIEAALGGKPPASRKKAKKSAGVSGSEGRENAS